LNAVRKTLSTGFSRDFQLDGLQFCENVHLLHHLFETRGSQLACCKHEGPAFNIFRLHSDKFRRVLLGLNNKLLQLIFSQRRGLIRETIDGADSVRSFILVFALIYLLF
jgi:hypothetical protein